MAGNIETLDVLRKTYPRFSFTTPQFPAIAVDFIVHQSKYEKVQDMINNPDKYLGEDPEQIPAKSNVYNPAEDSILVNLHLSVGEEHKASYRDISPQAASLDPQFYTFQFLATDKAYGLLSITSDKELIIVGEGTGNQQTIKVLENEIKLDDAAAVSLYKDTETYLRKEIPRYFEMLKQ